MRADGRKYAMRKRFAILIGVAATGVMALGAQTAAPAQAVVKYYDTTLSLTKDGGPNYHGSVLSDRDRNPVYHPERAVRKCMVGRRVVVFKLRPGRDRKLGVVRSTFHTVPYPHGDWWLGPEDDWLVGQRDYGNHVRAKVERKVGNGFVCRADRAPMWS